MIFHYFYLFGLFLTPFFLMQATPSPTLQNLNTYYLHPISKPILGQAICIIPELFERIKKSGFPQQALISAPTNSTSKLWQFTKGLPSNYQKPIVIYSGPRDGTVARLVNGRNGHSVRCTNAWLRNSMVHGPVVTFDYFFEAEDFEFGQGINIDCLKKIYAETIAKNPQAPIVITGCCIGSKIALEFAATNSCDQVKALILESPFIDIHKVVKNWDGHYLSWIPLIDASDIKKIFEWFFPHCKAAFKKPHAKLENVPNRPIFIAHLYNDSFCTNTDMVQLAQSLQSKGNTNVYLLVIKDTNLTHGRLNNKKEFAQATNAFLASHNMPHDKALAAQGKSLLAQARINAQAKTPGSWKIAQCA